MAKIFQYYFNPSKKTKKDRPFFDCFYLTPKNSQEKRLGHLLFLAEFYPPFPEAQSLFSDLKQIIECNFYKKNNSTTESAVKTTLEKVNSFLSKKLNKEESAPLDSLNLGLLAFNKENHLYVTKIGKIKILLLSEEQAFSIDQNLSSYPTLERPFPNIAEGTARKRDLVLITSPLVFENLLHLRLVEKLTLLQSPKQIKQGFQEKKDVLKQIFGCCLIVFITKKSRPIKQGNPFLSMPLTAENQQRLKHLLSVLVLFILLFLGYLLFKR